MATVIQPFGLRGDTAANWTAKNPVLLNKQEGYETDTRKRKVGDGVTPWNTLQYDVAATDGSAVKLDGLSYSFIYNGVDWVSPSGVVMSDANRPANTLRIIKGGPDPTTRGFVMQPGDEWKDGSA